MKSSAMQNMYLPFTNEPEWIEVLFEVFNDQSQFEVSRVKTFGAGLMGSTSVGTHMQIQTHSLTVH